jgi:cyclohexyl-isocyanide hydratase
MTIGMVVFKGLMQLDLTAPYEVFSRISSFKLSLIADSLEPIISDGGFAILPDTTFATAEAHYDMLFVPGGTGTMAAIENPDLMNFLRTRGATAQYITSVCTGALVLGVAGLLRGYRATTHWLSMDLLALFEDVTAVDERVVIDRNRITGGGVTAGLDFGLALIAHLLGAQKAQEIQLMLEYNPQPPFAAGSPQTVDPSVLAQVRSERAAFQEKRKEIILRLIEPKT